MSNRKKQQYAHNGTLLFETYIRLLWRGMYGDWSLYFSLLEYFRLVFIQSPFRQGAAKALCPDTQIIRQKPKIEQPVQYSWAGCSAVFGSQAIIAFVKRLRPYGFASPPLNGFALNFIIFPQTYKLRFFIPQLGCKAWPGGEYHPHDPANGFMLVQIDIGSLLA
jgi:hypothetical protein